MRESLNAVQEKSAAVKFRVEKSEGTPYRNHSYLLGDASLESRAAWRQVVPPCFSGGSPGNMLLV